MNVLAGSDSRDTRRIETAAQHLRLRFRPFNLVWTAH
jgi:hypothetical protein